MLHLYVIIVVLLLVILYNHNRVSEKMSVLDQRLTDLQRDRMGYTLGDYALLAKIRNQNNVPVI